MKNLKSSPALKAVAFLLCVVSAAAAFWSGLFSLRHWEDMWSEADYFASSDYSSDVWSMQGRVEALLELEHPAGGLTYSQQEWLSGLRTALDPANTNYRYELRLEQTGELVSSNLNGALLEDVAAGIQLGVFSTRQGSALSNGDEVDWARDTDDWGDEYEYSILRVWTGAEYLEFRADQEPEGFNEYGWYNVGGRWEVYDQDWDSRVTATEYALRAGVLRDLPIDDDFRDGSMSYLRWHANLPLIGAAALVSLAVCLLSAVYLFCAAGHRRGVEGVCPGLIERIPLDVYALAAFFVVMLGVSFGDPIAYALNLEITTYRAIGLLIVYAVVTATLLSLLLTTAVRLKTHTLWDSMLTLRACAWCWRTLGKSGGALWRGVKNMVRILSMNVRLGLAFLVYLLLNAFLAYGFFSGILLYGSWGYFFIGLILFNGGVFWLGCRWIEQWQLIRENTRRILGGDSGTQIDTRRMYSDLKEHAEQLNDLGTTIDHAVDERLKSEHFKAELITNVSHDLKTPLTSIINYVDLLKKLDIDDPKAREYLEVLDRKGQRLKKLTEDLVEASKASTGNVTVNAVHMDLVEFTKQAVAEYEDRLLQQGLTLITKMADHAVYINADGRHMWRILDNLLGNCVKYALEGTRVYLDVVEWDGKASIALKNISRDALDVDPESLTERFVRGDESRTTEGSGLGLSIARSLTEVQGGTLRITTDGDLFKATVFFPVVLALEGNPSRGRSGELEAGPKANPLP